MPDRHVLCTGGSGALGTKVTAALLRTGARVTVPTFAHQDSSALMGELGGLQAHVRLVPGDLRDEQQVAAVLHEMPRVDALVHLVGGFAMGPTHEFGLEQFREQVDLNLTMTFLVVKHALKRMKASGYGRIVTVASRAALEPSGASSVYSACKAAVLAFTRAVADETRGTDITANCVLPSIIDTPTNRQAMGDAEAHKWVKPERMAETIAFLASEAAGDLRGSAVRVYGNA